ncbi:MAG TPA: ATP-binding protein, partial [Bifidobacterium pullorum]|nr:ATP-binding protein [Bifidobacterium pullorum]
DCLVIEASNAAASPSRRSFRGVAAHGRRFASHGWGLSIIRGIAERHGGTFDVSYVAASGDEPQFVAKVVVPCPAQSVMT